MSLLAVIILTLSYLTNIPLGQPARQVLQDAATSAKADIRLQGPAPHQPLAEPIRTGPEELKLAARAAYAVDLNTAAPLYQQNSRQALPIASITKIVTAMVIIKSHDLEEVVTVPALPSYRPEDAQLGLTPGQRFKLRDLLAASLIPSANDAADTLAIFDAGSGSAFAAKMNRLVGEWGITEMSFTNPSGLPDGNVASAENLAKISKIALANPSFSTLVATNAVTISDLGGKSYPLVSTNQLLADARIIGLKTGYTPTAGQSFVSLATIKGHRVITVVLNSPDRFGETTQLINWIERSYSWR
ncbi:MAG TPA: serine hydrolase [Candidatus Saccharimonadales bacterium]|nr:serine hydrolase [Candidatus Saccharimonadales bacterium]